MYPLSNPFKVGQTVQHIEGELGEVTSIENGDVTIKMQDDNLAYFYNQGSWIAMMQYFTPVDTKLPVGQSNVCFHDFKTYRGFREEYEYCTFCDHKRYP